MTVLESAAMTELLSGSSVHVLVVGDVILDRYLYGQTNRVSQEAPVPIVRVEAHEDRLGGAANVALNVVSLGARCTFVGAVGNDEEGHRVASLMEAAGINADLVFVDGWSTTKKQRVVSRHQQLLRTDFEVPMPVGSYRLIEERVEAHLGTVDAMVVEDYDKGAIMEPLRLIEKAKRHRLPIVADPKFKPFAQYRGVSVLKPNRREFRKALGFWPSDLELPERARELMQRAGIESMIVTRGGDGLTLFEKQGGHLHVPAVEVDVYDETGAGDTVAATLGIGCALGWDLTQSARVANVAGGIVCAKVGTAAVTAPELNNALASVDRPNSGSLTRQQLIEACEYSRSRGERIVFTNGCFDILHAGHVGYLAEARELGDRLIVAVNNDDSTRRLKGEGRPVNRLERRVLVLASLQCVDWVVPFSEDTPEDLLAEIRPDVIVKGGDYREDEVVGADFVKSYGGEVRVLSLIEDLSTTSIVEQIKTEAP